MLKGIVGIEITISRLEGKWKVNQNRPLADRKGAIRGFEALGDPGSLRMAEEIKKQLEAKVNE